MGRSTGAEAKGGQSILRRLTPHEAHAVLTRLLAVHPELVAEAEGIAKALIAKVSFEEVADDVEAELRLPNLDELNARAGPSRWGYTPPDEAAWELLEKALQPFVDEMTRYAELGMKEQALEMCRGILAGLYRLRDSSECQRNDEHAVLAWAPDFPLEAATTVIKTWLQVSRPKGSAGKARGPRPGVLEEFVREYLPEWQGLIGV